MHKSGNTILVTGGGSGIGRALAEAFHRNGNTVIIAGRRKAALAETLAANPGMTGMTLDIEDKASIAELAARLSREHATLNVLVNNAGIMLAENLLSENFDLGDSEATVATNLLGPIRLTAALLPLLRKQPAATIINVTSGLAFTPLALTPTYSATKAALHSYTMSMRYQLRDTNVRVVELAPPYVQTMLMGERQANDPMAMPLVDFISESMALLSSSPTPDEILVERVKPLRNAEASGNFSQFFKTMNDHFYEARKAEIK